MIHVHTDIWVPHSMGAWIVIPTNGSINKQGLAVMGRGLALQAAQRFPDIPQILGCKLEVTWRDISEPVPLLFDYTYRLIYFPVKYRWHEVASLGLIERSAIDLAHYIKRHDFGPVFMPKVGCGNGKLNWSDVEPILERILGDTVFVAHLDI